MESLEITLLLQEIKGGQEQARNQLFDLLYSTLHDMAERAMKHERHDHTLQPTALVHEVFMRLADENLEWQHRSSFLSLAARAMRNTLVDHARTRNAARRGGNLLRVSLGGVAPHKAINVDLVALDEQLEILAKIAPRQEKILEMCYFGGLTHEEIGEVLAISPSMVFKDIKKARGWLMARLI